MTRAQLLAQLDVLMGGRVGEELVFGADKVTTGAADDFRVSNCKEIISIEIRTFLF